MSGNSEIKGCDSQVLVQKCSVTNNHKIPEASTNNHLTLGLWASWRLSNLNCA